MTPNPYVQERGGKQGKARLGDWAVMYIKEILIYNIAISNVNAANMVSVWKSC